MNFLGKLGDFLDGKKTYIFLFLLFIFGLMDFKDYLPPILDQNKEEIYLSLLTGAGIAIRMGINSANKKLENDLITKLKGDK